MCDDSVDQNINEIFVNTGNLLESEELKRNITLLPGEEVWSLTIGQNKIQAICLLVHLIC